jgi:GWxTD domain-containing protein
MLSGRDAEAQKLASRHKEWLEKDVVYLISKEERSLFQNLPTDQDRDKFMERFWEIRNPVPGSPTNRFKDEHYSRFAYAQQHFGKESATDGWRTDRGRIYILLGPPQQRMFHNTHQKLRPFEVWFYSSPSPALPPFFYVVFLQRDNVGDYKLYSPYLDGPQRLVNAHQAEQGRPEALRVIQEVVGREVARISLSLLPDEPVDMQGATSSLQSDLLISALRDLANHPLHKSAIDRRKEILENVTFRLIHEDAEALDVLTAPFRNSQGDINLHYVMRLRKPGSLAVRQNGERYDYRVQASVRVMDATGKLLFAHEKDIAKGMERSEVQELQEKVFGYQGWLPLPPGQYKIEFTLTSWNNNAAFRANRDVNVPAVPTTGLFVTPPVAFLSAEKAGIGAEDLPFTFGGLRFTPLAGQNWSIAPGENLSMMYQIWRPAGSPRTFTGAKLNVEYAYGRPAARGDSVSIHEEVAKSQFDALGSLVNGKKIRLHEEAGGNYLMALTVSDPETQQKGFARLAFRVAVEARPPSIMDLYDQDLPEQVRLGVPEFQRGLCLLATGKGEEAKVWFQRTLQRNPDHSGARARLADIAYAAADYAGVIRLYPADKLTKQMDEKLVLRIAESHERVGQRKASIEFLQRVVADALPSRAMYLALADLYQREGDLRNSEEWSKRAAGLAKD